MNWSEADVCALHLEALSATPNQTELDCLYHGTRSALTRAQYDTAEDRPDPLHIAAYLLHQLGKVQHCLGDGNKRFAWHCALDYLRTELGVEVFAPQQAVIDLVLSVADENKKPGPAEIMRWLAKRLAPAQF